MKDAFRSLVIATSVLLTPAVSADEQPHGSSQLDPGFLGAVKQLLSQKMPGTEFQVAHSPIDSLVQVTSGERLFYFHPASETLVFGQIWDLNGKNLSEPALKAAVSAAMAERIEGLSLDAALTIGSPDAPEIVEYTNPDCGFCKRLQDYYFSLADLGEVRRHIVFSVPPLPRDAAGVIDTGQAIHPSTRKALHILCSDNPENTFNEIYAGMTPVTWNSCADGLRRLEMHEAESRRMNVRGTPTLLLDKRELVVGARLEDIGRFLQLKWKMSQGESS